MCWNEAEEGSGRTVFKAWEDRMDRDEMVESDVDPELLFHIPLVSLKHSLLSKGYIYHTSGYQKRSLFETFRQESQAQLNYSPLLFELVCPTKLGIDRALYFTCCFDMSVLLPHETSIYSFTGSVKLKGVVVIGGEDEQHPKELRL